MDSFLFVSFDTNTLIHILLLGFLGFLVSMLITPVYTTFAYKWQWWKRPQDTATIDEDAAIVMKLHDEKHKRLIPTMAGAVFVLAVCLVTLPFNLSRTETWLPLAAFVGAAVVGLVADIVRIRSNGKSAILLRTRLRLSLTALVALIGGLFFYFKLDVSTIHIPVIGTEWHIGWLIIPLFVLVVVATANAVNISDGLDGLAGGLTATAFAAYAVIALLEQRYGVAALCLTIVGALLSYTWFNVFPARFFMGDVGSFALGTALGVVAMLTDAVLLLPIIGLVFVAEAGSSALQRASERLRGKKLFKVSPIHYHFEASGWPETKVTMRFWVVGQVAAVLGLIVFLTDKYL
jgi:phospho-N-acetylmuramoyl-pentapeptide-transferase